LSWTHIKTLSCRGRSDVMTVPLLAAHYNGICHDRFLIIDDKEIYLIGASLKDLGRKCFGFTKMDAGEIVHIKRLAFASGGRAGA